MTLYRIAPHGDRFWKVQNKWLGVLWRDRYRLVEYKTYDVICFATEADAEKWIWDRLSEEAAQSTFRQVSQIRQDTIRPRVFP